jgi:hypothetical protein
MYEDSTIKVEKELIWQLEGSWWTRQYHSEA